MEVQKLKLEQICDVRRGASPRPIDDFYSTSGFPWVKISDATSSLKTIYKTATFIKESGISKSVLVYKGDLILSNSGTPALPKIMGIDACIHDGWLLLRNFKNIDKDYLYYFLLMYRKKVELLSTGTIFQNLNIDRIKSIIVSVPTIEAQKKIAEKLSILDKKIENNLTQVSNLEEYSQLLFHKWFVDFNFPDEYGNPYKDSGGEMIEVDGQMIPKRWNIKTIKDCTKHIKTGLNPRDNFTLNNGNIKYITVKNLSTNGAINFDNCDTVDEQAKNIINKRSDVQKGDILFASISPLGRCAIVHEKPSDWVINESVFSIRPNMNLITSEFLFLFLTNNQFVRMSEHKSAGSIFKGIRIKTLENTKLILSPKNIIDKFQLEIKNLLERQHSCHTENQLLTESRDLLIKKLIK